MERHLSKAPIREALVDIQVRPNASVGYTDLTRAFQNPDFGYHLKGPIRVDSFAIGVGPQGPMPPATSSVEVGVRLHSQDERYVLQILPDHLILSRLRPYENWDTLEAEAKRLWSLVAARLTYGTVVQVSVRYINDLQLPMKPGDQFSKYFHDLVAVPRGTPKSVERFLQRFELFDRDTNARMTLTLALNGLLPTGIAPMILDIAVRKSVNLRPDQPELWNELRTIKNLKNKSFFGTLTEEALELFE